MAACVNGCLQSEAGSEAGYIHLATVPERTVCTSGPLHLNLRVGVDSRLALTEGQRGVVLRLLSDDSFIVA